MEQRLGPIGAKKLGPNGTKFREKFKLITLKNMDDNHWFSPLAVLLFWYNIAKLA